MAEVLGILVNSDENFTHLINVARAAKAKGKDVEIFLTHKGVLLTQDPRFEELGRLAEVSLCKVSFKALNLDPDQPIPGIDETSFTNQSRHADLIYYSDRYLVL
ncbi:MAG: DsrE family protein [Deltaproteobacteria bacterium]|nr:DsrE family protein [Deltaproteobacteria bacterium]